MKSAILPSKREHVAVMRKATKVLLFISLSFLFTFTSCQNIFEDSVSDSESHTVQTDENNNQLPEQKQNGPAAPAAPVVIPKVSFKGSLNVNGALPEKMEKVLADPSIYDEEALEDENSSVFARLSRAARPKLPAAGSAYEYFVKATDQTGLAKEAVPQLDPDDNKYKYTLELEINKTWTFQAGFRKKAVGEEGDADYEPEKILLIDTDTEVDNSYSETLNEATPDTTHNFVLKPMKTPDGKGKLQLLMETIPPEVTQLKLFVPDEVDGHAVPWLSDEILEVALHSSTSITSSTGVAVNNYIRSKDDAFNIPSGAYDVTLIFYKTVTGVTEPVPCYISYQTINIFDNMVTDSWINESGASADEAINSTTGVFALSDTLMQNFLETTIYVGQPAGGTVSASNGNTGSAYSPLATLGRAFELIQVHGNGSPYRIYITGNQTGNFTIPAEIGTTQTSSIEISGIGNTPSVLDGNKTGTVLKVDSAVPVTLKNIRITNGKAESGSPTSGKGGGIYIASGASVTLGADAIIGGIPAGVTSAAISENSSSNYALSGGGVYCEGSLILKRGSEVSYNYARDSSFETGGGGGIRCKNGTLKIEDGSKISMNGSANAGAGIALEATDFIMTGGLVSDNRNNNAGGGIYNSACTRFVISGGVISGNHANTGGGLSISNGTTTESVISGNTLIEKNSSGSLGRGGGIYVSSGILNLQGVTIKNNTSVSTYPGGAVAVSGTATLKISGSTYIPYGVETSTETGVSTETGPGKNDIYLDSGKTITLESDLSRHTASDRLFVTLPAANWVRSTSVVTAATGFTITDTIKDKIGYTSAGWISSIESNTIKLDSPIYVKASGNATATGTSADPFDNIQHALSAMIDSNKDYVIYVDGTINGPQEIPAESMTPAFAAKSITIEGVNNGTLDGQSCNSSVLDIEATCDVTIRNLTIKGADNINTGSPSPALGGGINANTTGKLTLATGTIITENKCGRIGDGIGGGVYKSAGILEIKDGVEISRNTATSGGGIASMSSATIIMSGGTIKGNSVSSYGGGLFLNGGKLFMYGSAVIGTASESLTEYTVDQGCNLADTRGGGICALSGNVYIGFTGLDSSNNPVLATGEDALTGGIMGNYAGTEGAGIYSEIDRFIVGDGNISRNKTGENGKGGAIYNSSSCTIRGGNISDNIATYGGAIYNGETLKLEGGAKIPGSATAGANDIYLAVNTAPLTQYVVTVCASEFSHHSEATPIYLTLPAWERGTKILEAADTTVNIDSAKNYFNLTEGGWAKSIYDTDSDGTYDTVKITSPLYVAGSNNRVACSAPPASGACGTIAKPYATIAAALAASDLAEAGYTITIDGTVTGAQTISSPAANITLTGYKASGATSSTAKIDAGGTSGAGSALTVDASGKSVTISDLTITGGNAENGGGINIAAGTVTLTNGANILGNQATNGGGVYLAGSGSTLYMKGTSVIGDKNEYTASGNTINLNPTSQTGSGCANKADNGGGIYCNGGNVYVGCDNSGLNTTISLATAGGVRRNYAGYGGGIYVAGGTFMTASGQISFNWASSGAGVYVADGSDHKIAGTVAIKNNKAGNEGGGLYIGSGSTVSMSGSAKIEKNNAVSGGGASLFGTLNMSAGTIGGDSPDFGNTASSGGGVNIGVENSSPYPCGTFNMSGGTISYNSCGNNGGGVSIGSRTPSSTTYNGTFSMSGGIISNNTARSKGGAVLQFGKFNISGSASIPYGVTSDGTTTKSPGYNDVYLFKDTNTITVASSSLSGGTSVATVTPTAWKRGANIIEWGVSATDAQKTTIKGQIKLSKDDGDWNREEKTVSGKNYVCINSPIYVADATSPLSGFGKGKTKANGGNGTKSSPYDSIAEALKDTDLASVKKIKIAGTVKGAQTISGTLSTDTLTIEGYTEGGVTSALNGGFSSTSSTKGRPLTVSSAATVTIQNLTITGGYTSGSTDESKRGGGVYVKSGAAVNLADGAVVKGNYADNEGGGVYVESGAYFAAYGTSVIGDSSATAPQLYPGVDANQAKKGAGVYNAGGTLCFGKSINKSGTESGTASWTGGLLGNSSFGSGDGAAIWTSGTTNLYDGNIKFNFSFGSGGAIYIAENTSSVTMSGGTIFKNTAYDYGGAVYISSGATFNMSGGTMGGKDASNNDLPNKVTNYSGGAIYQGGTFNISASAYVYPGSEKTNDVYLPENKYVMLGATSLSAYTGTDKLTITPAVWKRGTTFLGGTNVAGNYTKFKCSDSEWSVVQSSTVGKIDADIYVAPTSSTTTVDGVTYGKGAAATAGGRGTKAKPYSTIADAVAQCWGGPKDTGTGVSRVINIVGTISGAQEIASTVTTSKARAIILKGVNTSATLNGGMSSTSATKKSTLTLSTAVPVTIQSLKITGGYASGSADADRSGGGINITAGTVTLSDNAKIYENNVASTSTSGRAKGAGLYVASGARLNISSSSAAIYSNGSVGIDGGGIYNDGTVDMTNGSIYSNTSGSEEDVTGYGGGVDNAGTFYMSGSASIYSNTSNEAGGIYNSGTLYLGRSASNASATLSGSITKNAAKAEDAGTGGGAIYNAKGGTVTMTSGTIGGSAANKNTAVHQGGAILNYGTFNMSGGTISYNEAGFGGGVYHGVLNSSTGTVTLSGGTISDNKAIKPYGDDDDYGGVGGGVYTETGMTMSGGSIYGNTAAKDGGGVYSGDAIVMSGGSIYGNTAAKDGGGVWIDGALYMSKTAVIGNSGATGYATGSTACSNYAAGKGGGVYATADGAVILGAKAYPWTTSSNQETLSGGIYYNYAGSDGGGIYNEGADGIYIYTGNINKNASATNGGGICSNLQAFEMSGGTIDGNYARSGGGIYFVGNTGSGEINLTLSGGTISGNTAEYPATGGGSIYPYGGGIYIGGKNSLSMTGGTISGNTASDLSNSNLAYGGGVYIDQNGSIFMSKKALIGDSGTSTSSYSNTAIVGGGISSNKGNVYLGYKDASTQQAFDSGTYGVCHNGATTGTGYGGGIYALNGVLKIASGHVDYNVSRYGGAVYLNTITTCDISGGYFWNNMATYEGLAGGALYVKKTSLEIANASFTSNSAPDGSGGAIYIDGSNNPVVTIKSGSSFNENSASKSGGAIYNASTGLTLDGGTFGNTANKVTASDGKGGAIYTTKKFVLGQATITKWTVKQNDVYLFGSSASIEPKSAIGNTISNKCLLTRDSWSVGNTVLVGSYITTHRSKFQLSDSSKSIGTTGLVEQN